MYRKSLYNSTWAVTNSPVGLFAYEPPGILILKFKSPCDGELDEQLRKSEQKIL